MKKKLFIISAILLVLALCLIFFFLPRNLNELNDVDLQYIGATYTVKSIKIVDSNALPNRVSTDYDVFDKDRIDKIINLITSSSYRFSLANFKGKAQGEEIYLDFFVGETFQEYYLNMCIISNSPYIKINGKNFRIINEQELDLFKEIQNLLKEEKNNIV